MTMKAKLIFESLVGSAGSKLRFEREYCALRFEKQNSKLHFESERYPKLHFESERGSKLLFD